MAEGVVRAGECAGLPSGAWLELGALELCSFVHSACVSVSKSCLLDEGCAVGGRAASGCVFALAHRGVWAWSEAGRQVALPQEVLVSLGECVDACVRAGRFACAGRALDVLRVSTSGCASAWAGWPGVLVGGHVVLACVRGLWAEECGGGCVADVELERSLDVAAGATWRGPLRLLDELVSSSSCQVGWTVDEGLGGELLGVLDVLTALGARLCGRGELAGLVHALIAGLAHLLSWRGCVSGWSLGLTGSARALAYVLDGWFERGYLECASGGPDDVLDVLAAGMGARVCGGGPRGFFERAMSGLRASRWYDAVIERVCGWALSAKLGDALAVVVYGLLEFELGVEMESGDGDGEDADDDESSVVGGRLGRLSGLLEVLTRSACDKSASRWVRWFGLRAGALAAKGGWLLGLVEDVSLAGLARGCVEVLEQEPSRFEFPSSNPLMCGAGGLGVRVGAGSRGWLGAGGSACVEKIALWSLSEVLRLSGGLRRALCSDERVRAVLNRQVVGSLGTADAALCVLALLRRTAAGELRDDEVLQDDSEGEGSSEGEEDGGDGDGDGDGDGSETESDDETEEGRVDELSVEEVVSASLGRLCAFEPSEPSVCAICLSEDREVRVLAPCMHGFHWGCLQAWTRHQVAGVGVGVGACATCPTCKCALA
jgi:hypothetical protein